MAVSISMSRLEKKVSISVLKLRLWKVSLGLSLVFETTRKKSRSQNWDSIKENLDPGLETVNPVLLISGRSRSAGMMLSPRKHSGVSFLLILTVHNLHMQNWPCTHSPTHNTVYWGPADLKMLFSGPRSTLSLISIGHLSISYCLFRFFNKPNNFLTKIIFQLFS